MSKNLNRHIRSDKAKWVITGIVLVLVVIMLVGMCLQLFGQGKVKPSEWFRKQPIESGEAVKQASDYTAFVPTALSNNSKLKSVSNSNKYNIFYEYSEYFESYNKRLQNHNSVYDFGFFTHIQNREYDYIEYSLTFDTKNVYVPFVTCFNPMGGNGYIRIYMDSDFQYSDGVWGKIVLCPSNGVGNLLTGVFSEPSNKQNGSLTFSYSYSEGVGSVAFYWDSENGRETLEFNSSEEFDTLLTELLFYERSDPQNPQGLMWKYMDQASGTTHYVDLSDEVGITHVVKLGTLKEVEPLPPTPTKEGYTFTGWYLDEACTQKYIGTSITADTALYAGWEINKYIVTFDSDGGSVITNKTVDWNTACALTTPTKTGYTFLGWYLSNGTQYTNQPIKSNTSLKAKWEINKYTVTFDSDGGSAVENKTAEWNTSVGCPTPVKEGFNFKGWYLSDGTQYTNQAITSNTTLKAQWEIKKLSVVFDMGGADEIADQVVDYGESVILETPMREGYNFLGWFLADGTKYTNQPIKENTIIKANWEIKRFTVTFYVDGAVYNTLTVDYGTRLKEVADRAEVFSQNVISYRFMNADLPVGELGDMVVVDDMEVEANAPSESDKAIGTIKNNWLPIVLGGIGLIALIAIISVVVTRKKRR